MKLKMLLKILFVILELIKYQIILKLNLMKKNQKNLKQYQKIFFQK